MFVFRVGVIILIELVFIEVAVTVRANWVPIIIIGHIGVKMFIIGT